MLILLLLPPLPYRGTSLSSSTRALHTGQSWQVEWLWSHRYRHGQQKRWPQRVTTGSCASSRQMLQSKPEEEEEEEDDDDDGDGDEDDDGIEEG